MSTKNVTLRAYKISNNDLSLTNSGLLKMMSNKLKETTVQARRMLLNENDPSKEEDLISHFNISTNESLLFASILRIREGKETASIPSSMFQKSSFSLSELQMLNDISSVYKDIQYIVLSNDIVIVCWFGSKTIKSIQTYINWLLENERENFVFELTSMLRPIAETQLNEIKSIKMKDTSSLSSVSRQQGNAGFIRKNLDALKGSIMEALFDNIQGLNEQMIEEVISAELLIKFNKKPKEMKQEDYDKTFGAVLKPISDLEDVTFTTKKGGKIEATAIVLTKKVSVDITSNNQVSEKSLYQEMEIFMNEIQKIEQ